MRNFITSAVALCGVALFAETAGAVAYSDPNLLSGLLPTVSSEFAPDYTKDNATDGAGGGLGVGNDFVFASGDAIQNIVIHGFDSQVGLIRLFFGDLQPTELAIYSSLADTTSLVPGSFETTLLTTTTLTNLGGSGYIDFPVNAPPGTSSLLFDFGPFNYTLGGNGFSRIQEFQAFVPEHSSVVMLGLGAIGLIRMVRRRRA